MKTIFLKSLVLLLSLYSISSGLAAQKKGPPPHHELKPIEKIMAYKGKVTEWTYNNDFIYDGFYLQTDSEKLFIKFPKHMGKQMRTSLSNNNIIVNGIIRYSPEGRKEIQFTSINSNDKIIHNFPERKPIEPLEEKYIANEGKINRFQKNDKGDITGLILTDKIILKIPPHKILQLLPLLKVGEVISFTGFEKPETYGEAYADKYTSINCKTITCNGEQYLVK